MSANLPLNEMSLEEKLQAMEALWEDLSREPVCEEGREEGRDAKRDRSDKKESERRREWN
jgi:hypothetical protein